MNNTSNNEHPVVIAAKKLGNKIYECIQHGYSLRLIAALIDTKSYGVVYQSMISAEKGRGCVRGPTPEFIKKALNDKAQHIIAAMTIRNITPRKWCNAYNLDLDAVIDPQMYEWNTDREVTELLKEDFPELYPGPYKEYEHAYKKMPGFGYMYIKNKKVHLYETTDRTLVMSRNKGKALMLATKVQAFNIHAQRLSVLLTLGKTAALAWVPDEPVIDYTPQTEIEKKIFEAIHADF